ncbi:hypothetical protein D3C86_1837860 [compost metagenome]
MQQQFGTHDPLILAPANDTHPNLVSKQMGKARRGEEDLFGQRINRNLCRERFAQDLASLMDAVINCGIFRLGG